MDAHQVLDDAKAALRLRADANGDGKIDMQDVASVIAVAKSKAADETTKHPIGAICVTAAVVFVLTAIGMKLFGC
jgi:hypothetical protein